MTEFVILEKFQPKIQRGTEKKCFICANKFSTIYLNPQHQCKRCMSAVCKTCSNNKRYIYFPNEDKSSHRVCNQCLKQSQMLVQYISVHQLQFGKDSAIGRKWHNGVPSRRLSTASFNKQNQKFSKQTFQSLWQAYNFSFREFIGLLTQKLPPKQVYNSINTVYSELQQLQIDDSMQNIVFIIIFMLCFSGPDMCVELCKYMISLKKKVIDEKKMVSIYLKALGVDPLKIKQITECFNIKQFIGQASINAVTAESSIITVSKVFEKQRIDEIYMLLAIVLQQNLEQLLQRKGNKFYPSYLVVKNCDMVKYKEKFGILTSVNVSQVITVRSKSTLNIEKIDDQSDIVNFPNINKKQSPQERKPISQIISPQNLNGSRNNYKSPFQQSNSINSEAKKVQNNGNSKNETFIKKGYSIMLETQPQQNGKKAEDKQKPELVLQNKKDKSIEKPKQQSLGKIKASEVEQQNDKKQKQQKGKDTPQLGSKIEQTNQKEKKQGKRRESQSEIQNQQKLQKATQQTEDQKQQELMIKKEVEQKPKTQKLQQDELKNTQPRPKESELEVKPTEQPQQQQSLGDEQCLKCQQKLQQLREKTQQISKQMDETRRVKEELKSSQVEVKRLKSELQESKTKVQAINVQTEDAVEELQKLKYQKSQDEGKINKLLRQIAKYQRQNKSLMTQVEKLNQSNKQLKQTMEDGLKGNKGVSMNATVNKKKILSVEQCRLVQQKLLKKNQDLEKQRKEKKQLKIKLQEVLKQHSKSTHEWEEKRKKLQKEKEDFFDKVKELSEIAMKAQEEKLGMSSQIFELKEKENNRSQQVIVKGTQETEIIIKDVSIPSEVITNSQQKPECTTF